MSEVCTCVCVQVCDYKAYPDSTGERDQPQERSEAHQRQQRKDDPVLLHVSSIGDAEDRLCKVSGNRPHWGRLAPQRSCRGTRNNR